MLFEELVEQHRVHRLVAHRVSFSVSVASNEIGVHLLHLLGHEAKLRDAFRVKLVLVAEGHRFKREDRFACLIHRLNRVLETLRGRCHAKLTVAIYNNSRARNGRPANASDECRSLRSLLADTNGIGFPSNTSVKNIDVVTARGEISTSVIAQCDVAVPGCVANERSKTIGSVAFAGGILTKRSMSVGGVEASGCVAKERIKPVGGVGAPDCVAKERINPVGSIVIAPCVGKERLKAGGRVGAPSCVAKERFNTEG